ncbi:MAG TPA: glycosyl hydrolase 53 family protein, partial [Chitinophagaceae bacterium]
MKRFPNGAYPTLLFSCAMLISVGCAKSASNAAPGPVPPFNSFFAKGADVSWVTEMESKGIAFHDAGGNAGDCLSILKGLGLNAVRLRVWVNPADGWCNTADVVRKALRAKALGIKLLIDFHYSDWWADPGKQNKPAAWANQDFGSLKQSVVDHTTSVLAALRSNGIVPEWVQVGNETNDGMLWPDGRASISMKNFADLIDAGYNAVKSLD